MVSEQLFISMPTKGILAQTVIAAMQVLKENLKILIHQQYTDVVHTWQEIMDMIKYSSLRSPVICVTQQQCYAWLTSPLQIFTTCMNIH